MSRVIGLDLSLTSTGVASSLGWVRRLRVHPSVVLSKFSRTRFLRAQVLDHVRGVDLVVVEGPSFGSGTMGRQTGHHERAGLWWIVMEAVENTLVPWMEIPPAVLKKYATGKGNASKDEVLSAAVRRFPEISISGNDEADALWLAALGADVLGEPMMEMPTLNRSVLTKLEPVERRAA